MSEVFRMKQSFYDKDYFERGLESGKSCYQNYRWEPELTIPMAMTIIDYLGIRKGERVLDFGAAKGYLVKALRLLYRDAWGYDVSKYALSNADAATDPFCSDCDILEMSFDYCIAKDVFEHIEKEELHTLLDKIKANTLFVIVPLGDKNGYRAPNNNFDKSHIICEDGVWWVNFLTSSKVWRVRDFKNRIDGIKDSYYKTYPEAHGFITLKK